MSASVYGAPTSRPIRDRAMATGTGTCVFSSMRSESPQSRLSKRTTRKPAFTSPSTNASGQKTSGMPRPITSRIGGAPAAPLVS